MHKATGDRGKGQPGKGKGERGKSKEERAKRKEEMAPVKSAALVFFEEFNGASRD